MELALNLAWLVLAVSMAALWLRFVPQRGHDRRMQFVALALVILILLPAISMTDDLIAARNPAEVDVCLRRDHNWASSDGVMPMLAVLVLSALSSMIFETACAFALGSPGTPVLRDPALSPISDRPPPLAA